MCMKTVLPSPVNFQNFCGTNYIVDIEKIAENIIFVILWLDFEVIIQIKTKI